MTSRPANRKKKQQNPDLQRRRRLSPRRPSFSLLALTLALPALAVLGFFAWKFVRSSMARQVEKPPAVVEAPGKVPRSVHPPKSTPSGTALQPEIALILDDVGFDPAAMNSAASIGSSLSFAILPNAPHASEAAKFLQARGFEILCHLPMEPGDSRNSPGPGAILSSMSDQDIRTATALNLRAVPEARGMNNHMGSRATADPRVMKDVLSMLPAGWYFIDSRTTADSVGERTARQLSIPTASRDVFLDDVRTEVAIRGQLAELAALARRQGHAVGIGHMYPVTIAVLKEELPRLREKGFHFVRASEVVD